MRIRRTRIKRRVRTLRSRRVPPKRRDERGKTKRERWRCNIHHHLFGHMQTSACKTARGGVHLQRRLHNARPRRRVPGRENRRETGAREAAAASSVAAASSAL